MSSSRSGSCFCGAVQLLVTGQPSIVAFCHCSDCTSWAGAPLQAFSLWTPNSIEVSEGLDKLGTYTKSGDSHRKFCTECGGHIMNERPDLGMNSVYVNLTPALDQQATLHVYYEEKTISIVDGLPKYKDVPSEFGGTGEILPD
jgi:hypothetical protein